MISGRLRSILLRCWRPGSDRPSWSDPVAIARATGATVLIGASACAGAFTEALVREVGLHDPVPIMLPLSNPSACAEARPEDILTWTEGRALVATGGPSRDVSGPTGVRVIGQANNVFVFPGMGLGAIVSETREVTDDMFLVAAHELAGLVSDDRLREGAIYPPIAGLRAVARAIAVAVVREARDSGHGRAYSDDGDRAGRRPRDVVARLRPVRAGRLIRAETHASVRPARRGGHIARPARALDGQTRSNAIATDPPPPRHRVARP